MVQKKRKIAEELRHYARHKYTDIPASKNLLFFLIYFWLCWVFISVRGPSPVAESGGHPSSRCTGLSPSRPLLLQSAGSAIMAHGRSCSAACGILPDQGSNPCPLHWQADSQPLRHQGSLEPTFLNSEPSWHLSGNLVSTKQCFPAFYYCSFINLCFCGVFHYFYNLFSQLFVPYA